MQFIITFRCTDNKAYFVTFAFVCQNNGFLEMFEMGWQTDSHRLEPPFRWCFWTLLWLVAAHTKHCYLWRLISAIANYWWRWWQQWKGVGWEGRSQANEGLDRGCYPVSFWWDYCGGMLWLALNDGLSGVIGNNINYRSVLGCKWRNGGKKGWKKNS